MGAWGYGPLDNDDAGDFWYEMRHAKNPMKKLEEALNNRKDWKQNERRAATAFVQLLLKFDRRSLQRQKKLAVDALKELKSNSFSENWRSPAAVKKRLGKEIKDLNGS